MPHLSLASSLSPIPNAHPLSFSSTPYGCRLHDIPTDHLTRDGWHPTDCINLDRPDGSDRAPPPGWYSVPHWAALTEWRAFGGWDADMSEILGEWLGEPWQDEALRLTLQEGMKHLEWTAPPRIRELGYPTIPLFPDPVLRMLFGR